jgi:hypothetical protein
MDIILETFKNKAMKISAKDNNRRDFYSTCANSDIIETETALYKFVSMFGPKTLIYWKHSGKISVRTGHNAKGII